MMDLTHSSPASLTHSSPASPNPPCTAVYLILTTFQPWSWLRYEIPQDTHVSTTSNYPLFDINSVFLRAVHQETYTAIPHGPSALSDLVLGGTAPKITYTLQLSFINSNTVLPTSTGDLQMGAREELEPYNPSTSLAYDQIIHQAEEEVQEEPEVDIPQDESVPEDPSTAMIVYGPPLSPLMTNFMPQVSRQPNQDSQAETELHRFLQNSSSVNSPLSPVDISEMESKIGTPVPMEIDDGLLQTFDSSLSPLGDGVPYGEHIDQAVSPFSTSPIQSIISSSQHPTSSPESTSTLTPTTPQVSSPTSQSPLPIDLTSPSSISKTIKRKASQELTPDVIVDTCPKPPHRQVGRVVKFIFPDSSYPRSKKRKEDSTYEQTTTSIPSAVLEEHRQRMPGASQASDDGAECLQPFEEPPSLANIGDKGIDSQLDQVRVPRKRTLHESIDSSAHRVLKRPFRQPKVVLKPAPSSHEHRHSSPPSLSSSYGSTHSRSPSPDLSQSPAKRSKTVPQSSPSSSSIKKSPLHTLRKPFKTPTRTPKASQPLHQSSSPSSSQTAFSLSSPHIHSDVPTTPSSSVYRPSRQTSAPTRHQVKLNKVKTSTPFAKQTEIAALEARVQLLKDATECLANAWKDDEIRDITETWLSAGREVVERIYKVMPEPEPAVLAVQIALSGIHSQGPSALHGSALRTGGRFWEDEAGELSTEQKEWLAAVERDDEGRPIDHRGELLIHEDEDDDSGDDVLQEILRKEMRLAVQRAKSSSGRLRSVVDTDGNYNSQVESPRESESPEDSDRRADTPDMTAWNYGTMMLLLGTDPAILGWSIVDEEWA